MPSGRLNCLQGAIKITLPCHSYISGIITYINLSSIQFNSIFFFTRQSEVICTYFIYLNSLFSLRISSVFSSQIMQFDDGAKKLLRLSPLKASARTSSKNCYQPLRVNSNFATEFLIKRSLKPRHYLIKTLGSTCLHSIS